MKIWPFSDLHLEYMGLPKGFTVPEADLCIAAGDIDTHGGVRSLNWLNSFIAPHMPVIFVPGNHEFYKHSLVDALELMHDTAATMKRIHFLHNDSVLIDDILFVGATLWTDFSLHGNPELSARAAGDRQRGMNDYRKIKFQKNPWMRFTPYRSATLHRESRTFIERALTETNASRKFVVTHHAPSIRSFDPDKGKELIAGAYASDMDEFVERTGADYWVHGHIHRSSRYRIGKTEIISNPRGYGNSEEGTSFDPKMIIEVA